MLEHTFTTKAFKCEYSTNEFNERVLIEEVEIYVRFRDIANIDRANEMEVITSNAMLWAKTDANLKENDIIRVSNDYYSTVKVVYAKRLGSETVQYLKCYLERHKEVVS